MSNRSRTGIERYEQYASWLSRLQQEIGLHSPLRTSSLVEYYLLLQRSLMTIRIQPVLLVGADPN